MHGDTNESSSKSTRGSPSKAQCTGKTPSPIWSPDLKPLSENQDSEKNMVLSWAAEGGWGGVGGGHREGRGTTAFSCLQTKWLFVSKPDE